MKKDFDFNMIGRRTPYQVPEGFFDRMEHETLKKVSEERKKARSHHLRIGISVALAVAAMLCGVIFLQEKPLPDTVRNTSEVGWIAQNNGEQDAMDLYLQGLTDEELEEWIELTENDVFYTLTTENYDQDEN